MGGQNTGPLLSHGTGSTRQLTRPAPPPAPSTRSMFSSPCTSFRRLRAPLARLFSTSTSSRWSRSSSPGGSSSSSCWTQCGGGASPGTGAPRLPVSADAPSSSQAAAPIGPAETEAAAAGVCQHTRPFFLNGGGGPAADAAPASTLLPFRPRAPPASAGPSGGSAACSFRRPSPTVATRRATPWVPLCPRGCMRVPCGYPVGTLWVPVGAPVCVFPLSSRAAPLLSSHRSLARSLAFAAALGDCFLRRWGAGGRHRRRRGRAGGAEAPLPEGEPVHPLHPLPIRAPATHPCTHYPPCACVGSLPSKLLPWPCQPNDCPESIISCPLIASRTRQ